MKVRDDWISVERPIKAVKTGEKIKFAIWIPDSWGFVSKATLLICKHGDLTQKAFKMDYLEKSENVVSKFETEITIEDVGIHYFYFAIVVNEDKKVLKYDYRHKKSAINEGDLWKFTVYDKNFNTPHWANGKLIYHIFLDRFYNSTSYCAPALPGRTQLWWGDLPIWKPNSEGIIKNNEFFMGNLLGVIEKLEYLNELGVEILYLSPVCKSQSSHRYDTADYQEIDPYLGDKEILKLLCNNAHKLGIRIILDSVFNHTGDESKYFNRNNHYNSKGAYQCKDSPYYNWYKQNGDSFEYWWGFENLPVCNGYSKEWKDFICGVDGVIDQWFELGIDGLRLDVADELTDEFISEIRKAVHRNKQDGYIIGEVWEDAIEKEVYGKKRQYLLGNGLDSVMNYPFSNAILKYIRFGDVACFEGTINSILENYPLCSIKTLMTSLSTHDITRAMTTLAGDGITNQPFNWIWDVNGNRQWQYENDSLKANYELAKKRFKLATIIQYFLPGNPCIFYGDEAGLHGYKDPFNRKCYPWGKEDKDLQEFFRRLGQVRKRIQNIGEFDFKILNISKEILVFERASNNTSIIVIINRTDNQVTIDIPSKYLNPETEIFSINRQNNTLLPYGGIILKTV